MALIKCPECNNSVSEQASNCPNCGFPIREHLEQQKQQAQNIELAHAKAYQYVKQQKKKEEEKKQEQERLYNNAVSQIDFVTTVAEVDSLIKSFQDFGNYKEAPIKVDELCSLRKQFIEAYNQKRLETEAKRSEICKKLLILAGILVAIGIIIGIVILIIENIIIPNTKYNNAKKYLEQNKYGEAVEIFKELHGYKDSDDSLYEAQNSLASSMMDTAVDLLKKNNISSAWDILNRIPDIDKLNKQNKNRYITLNPFHNNETEEEIGFSRKIDDPKDSNNYYVYSLHFKKDGTAHISSHHKSKISKFEGGHISMSLGHDEPVSYNASNNT